MYTENKRPINRCQYWSIYEPVLCSFWDKDKTVCTYDKVSQIDDTTISEKADFYPYCNYIGTSRGKCKQYNPTTSGIGQEEKPRCVLPDPYRHLYMSPHCSKWVVPTTNASGTLDPLDYSKINEYNNGECNYKSGDDTTGGTSVTCSGFSAHHLGFGSSPIAERCTLSGTNLDNFLNTEKKLPFNFDILNKRSDLGRCYRWSDNEDYLFTITAPNIGTLDYKTGKISAGDIAAEVPLTINPPRFSCTDPSKEAQAFATFYNDKDNNYIRPPCNGAMPDCPRYTGNLASTGYLPFLSSVYLRNGDKVMAEQILELRYNLQKETWNPKEYEDIFGKDAAIYAHTGQSPEIVRDSDGNIQDYSLASTKVSIKDFMCFIIDRTKVLLTPGTPSDNNKISFDTLIKELNDLFLEPIIRSFFDTVYLTNDKNLSYIQKTQYIFETTKTDHKKILLIGDYFYDKNIFAINISDPDISFPFKYLFDLGNMSSFRRTDISKRVFKEKHDALICYLKVLMDTAPEKLYYNESADDDRCFMISVDTFFGENKIMVFDTSNEIYTFDVITIEKHFCGGIIAQTEFQISSLNEFVDTNENYEAYSCLPRYDPKITYEFKPLNTSTGSYTTPYLTYLDTRVVVPPANPMAMAMSENLTLFLGYTLYKIKALPHFFISTCDTTTYSRFIFLGNAGKMLVIIDDGFKLHAIVRKWDTGEVDSDGNSKPIVLFLNGLDADGAEKSIEMEVLEYCSDRLEINQMIIKPKNPNDYVRLYSPVIDFKSGLYIYEKYSFGKTPKDNGYAESSFTKLRDGYPEDDLQASPPRITTIIQDLTELAGDFTSGTYNLSRLPTFPIVASVIFRGALTTRIRGQVKSDLLLWIKQPFCSDVEINYNWTANYKRYIVQPTGYCFVSAIDLTYVGTVKIGYSPGCGDHNFGRISQRPSSMWYPYTACDEYAKYNIMAGSGEFDIAPMEFWLNAVGHPIVGRTPYGSQNLRMLGPSAHYGMTTDTHASIWACHCDYTHENSDMISEPWFSGNAKIRSGVEGEALFYMTQNGGIPPKFGNKKRGYLLSFRSTAALYYYKVTDAGSFVREKKWLPAYEAFSDVTLSDSFKEYPWLHYFNLTDNITTYISQLGLGAVINDINGVTVNEELVYDTTDPSKEQSLKRYAFTDIFKAHYTATGMLYPEPRKKYYLGLSQKPITAWLTYKDYPDDATKSIQWAWRELWKPIKRDTPDIRQLLRDIDLTLCNAKEFYKLYLSFMDIAYTNYTYNFYISEFRRIPKEGPHQINWLPSTYNKDNPLPTHFILRIDGGPLRLLNSKCELITEEADVDPELKFDGITTADIIKHIKLYNACKGANWLNGITDDMALEAETVALQAISGNTSFIVYDAETAIVETEVEAKD
ncbi:hypothetical protein JZU46_05290, partial [bacterium]|nr:hypothetical protein [bacterium]